MRLLTPELGDPSLAVRSVLMHASVRLLLRRAGCPSPHVSTAL